MTIVLDDVPADWRSFRDGDDGAREVFIASRRAAIKAEQSQLLAWLQSKSVKTPHSSWLANLIDTELPAGHVSELVKRPEVRDIGLNSDVKGNRAWAGKESQDALRLTNLANAGFKGHRGSRSGGATGSGGRIRIAVIEARQTYPNWPLREHPGWKRTEPGGATRLRVVRDCATSACPFTAATQTLNDDATHGTLVSWAAGGSIEHGQDAVFPGVHTDDQRVRSGHLHDSYIFYYMENGALSQGFGWAIDQAVADGADIINISASIATPCDRTQDPAGINARLRNALNAGVVVVAAAGNDGAGSCTVNYPANRPEVIAVGALQSDSEVKSYEALGMLLPSGSGGAGSGASRGGMPVGIYGSGMASISGVDLVAPGILTYYFAKRFPPHFQAPIIAYGIPPAAAFGSSVSSPVIAGAAGAMRNALELSGFDMTNGRALMANILLMGDGWNADSNSVQPSAMSTLSGAGRFRGHFPSSQDLTAPWAWGWRAVLIRQGEHAYWPVGDGSPLPSNVTLWKTAILWTPNDLNAVPDVDFWVEDICTGTPQTIYSDTGYDVRVRFRVAPPLLAGKCLRMHAYGYSVPPEGVTFYAADYFHSGPSNVH